MPELARTHDIEQDETHKESIVRYIERHVESLSAVLIFAVKDSSVRTEYTFSTLSAIFPKPLVDNIAFISTDSPSNPTWAFPMEEAPEALKSSPVFTLHNPISLSSIFPVVIKNWEDRALYTLVELFDWLDDREPQPVKEIVSLYEKYQNITTILDQRAREVVIDTLKTRLEVYLAVSLLYIAYI